MVDMFNPNATEEMPPMEPPPASEKTGRLSQFMATSLGRIVVGGVALAVLLAIAGTVAFMFLFAQEPDLGVNPAPGNTVKPPPSASEDETITLRPPKSDTDTFVFRNPFKPSVKPVVVSGSTGGSGNGSGSGGSGNGSDLDPSIAPQDTLYLHAVNVEDGVELATFFWNGSVYILPEGQVLEGTPWRILRIEGGTATMLYGDTQVTLTVGQGVGK